MDSVRGLGFLGEATGRPDAGVGPQLWCVRPAVCVCTCASPRCVQHTGDCWRDSWRSGPRFNRRWQQPDLASPCSLPAAANLCAGPRLCRMVWIPARPFSHACPRPGWSHWPQSQGWSLGPFFGGSFKAPPAALALRRTDRCAPNRMGEAVGGT